MYKDPPGLPEGDEFDSSNPSAKEIVFSFLFDKVLFFFNDSVIL